MQEKCLSNQVNSELKSIEIRSKRQNSKGSRLTKNNRIKKKRRNRQKKNGRKRFLRVDSCEFVDLNSIRNLALDCENGSEMKLKRKEVFV